MVKNSEWQDRAKTKLIFLGDMIRAHQEPYVFAFPGKGLPVFFFSGKIFPEGDFPGKNPEKYLRTETQCREPVHSESGTGEGI